MTEMNDISLNQQVENLEKICIDRISNLVKNNGFDEGDEYVLDFVKMPRLAFYIDRGERICIDRISLVKESGDLFGENIEDFDDVMKYDMKKYFSIEDFAAIESHFDSFGRPVLAEKSKKEEYVLIWEDNENERTCDMFDNFYAAQMNMTDMYDKLVKITRLIKDADKKLSRYNAHVKAGNKTYYRARIIEKTMPFAVVGGADVFDDNCKVSGFLTYGDARKYVSDMGFEDYMIV